jgi:hypothetical protein
MRAALLALVLGVVLGTSLGLNVATYLPQKSPSVQAAQATTPPAVQYDERCHEMPPNKWHLVDDLSAQGWTVTPESQGRTGGVPPLLCFRKQRP